MAAPASLSPWLNELRRSQIVAVVRSDPRSTNDLVLGVPGNRVFSEVIEGGQADFDADWAGHGVTLSGDDRALLYAFYNQPRHLEELHAAFAMLTREAEKLDNPVVLDLGCGPCTGGLALADALGADAAFTYIGVDRAASMRSLGETLACEAIRLGHMGCVTRKWVASLKGLSWDEPQGWRPILVIVSYLLASPTVDAVSLLDEVMAFADQIGRGPVVVLYTNSVAPGPNRQLPAFEKALERHGFVRFAADEEGAVAGSRGERSLRYALFSRQPRQVLSLGGE